MALLIATELFTLLFAMNTLSAVRSFVGGEGLWSKAQKLAVRNLQSYATTKNENYYEEFQKSLKVPLGDRRARFELMKENFDPKVVRLGFIQGRIHEDDIDGLINIIRRFHAVPHLNRALTVWAEGDQLIDELIIAADQLHTSVQTQATEETIKADLENIYEIDTRLTIVEDKFSYILGEGSRWLEKILMMILITTIIIVEGSGLFLTFKFSQNLTKTLNDLNEVTKEIGKKNFDKKAIVHSKDELGQLALAINKMSDDLKSSLGRTDKAESDNQIKTIFLANMSHEIRTPVGIIMGFGELLKDDTLSQHERNHYIDTINKTGNNLLRIINDILDISRVESGHLEVSLQDIHLPTFMANLISFLQVKAQQTNNRLIFKPIGAIPATICSDETRLSQILINLINNSLKFTEKGIVEVRYWAKNDFLHFEVTDNGTGIDEAGRAKLFQLFSQVDSASSRKHQGSGLGLVLSKRLANLLGGDVFLKSSTPGIGSTFESTIKMHPANPRQNIESIHKTISHDRESLKGVKILVVDDSVDNQLLIRIHLAKAGAEVILANDGREGVNKALMVNPDIVLMDMQMPIKDGYSATKELRDQNFTKPIIALTANAMLEDRNYCLEAGCNDYLSKPIETENLFKVLAKHLNS